MDTDYENYSMVYACEENDMAYLWILSRTPVLDQDILDSLNKQAMERLPNYDWSKASLDKQGGKCKYAKSSADLAILANWF